MKTTLCFTLTLLTFAMLAFVPSSFAQDDLPEYVVRFIHFLPNNQEPDPDIDKLDGWIKDAQQFYADEMERHGFGRKTFRLETDEDGKTLVHHITGRLNDISYYPDHQKMWDEIYQQFEPSEQSKNIYCVFFDVNYRKLIEIRGICDTGIAYGGGGSLRGSALVSIYDGDDNRILIKTIIHELGHAFGLSHDFRSDSYVMSYGLFTDELSLCAAKWLNNHRYFNTRQNAFNADTTIKMLPPSLVPPFGTIRIRFEATDPDGLRHAQLLAIPTDIYENKDSPELRNCVSLNEDSNIIEFVTTELTADSPDEIYLHVIDTHGNFIFQFFPINITHLLQTQKGKVLSIPDANLAAVVRKTVGLAPNAHITQLDMLKPTTFEAQAQEIKDLTGLEHAIHLQYLNLRGNQITDITLLSGLTRLKRLWLADNRIGDITPLKTLTNLILLNLSGNSIRDLAPFTELTQVETLQLYNNNISDISPLAELTNLGVLLLFRNQISDITALTTLTNLSILNLSHNSIQDLTPLTELTQLRALYLDRNNISDISPLTRLTQLTSLSLDHNQISDVTPLPLTALTSLIYLGLAGNRISDISPLAELKSSERFNTLKLGYNQISDITSLKGLTQLEKLLLQGNRISDVSPLAELVNLEGLHLEGNPIKDRKPLLDLLKKNPDVKIYLKPGGEPLPVTLSHFRAEHTDAGVVIKWTTESEVDNAGFYIYRSQTKDGEFKVVNPTMIQGAGTTSERNTYTWTDTTAKPNVVYYYQIEDISHAGVRKQLATVRMRGLVSASGKLTTRWADLKTQN